MAHHFIMLRLNPFGLRVDGEGWWFCVSAEGAKNVSWPWLYPLRGWHLLCKSDYGIYWYI